MELLGRDTDRLLAKQIIGSFTSARCWHPGHQVAVQGILNQLAQWPILVSGLTLGATQDVGFDDGSDLLFHVRISERCVFVRKN